MTSQEYKDKKEMFNALNEIVKELESKKNETLNGNIKRNDKISEGGWTPLREKDKKCMILTLKGKDLIRSVGSIEQYGLPTSKLDSCKDFAASENKFLLCDGIEYQTVASSSAYNRGLIFMEV